MIVLQISIEVNSGSVGKIAEQIGEKIIEDSGVSYITFARNNLPSTSNVIKIGTMNDVYFHILSTRMFDDHALQSTDATKKLIKQIEEINPDIIHLHHLHGYFINIDVLFTFLKVANKPVIWTFHDCWSFTGHCAHFEYVACEKWKTQCFECPQTNEYPKSLLIDRSKANFIKKKELFTSLRNMVIVPVSHWLSNEVKQSFFKNYPIVTIQNGIDLEKFRPLTSREKIENLYNIDGNKKIILGVASTWDIKKGLGYFSSLATALSSSNFKIILVGLSSKQLREVPAEIIGIRRTESVEQLAELYAAADVFVNPTLEDTFPTTNLEALACGTPVVTFRTGGSVESVDENTGCVVGKGNILELIDAINNICNKGKAFYSNKCRIKAERHYNKHDRFSEYISLYKKVLTADIDM